MAEREGITDAQTDTVLKMSREDREGGEGKKAYLSSGSFAVFARHIGVFANELISKGRT